MKKLIIFILFLSSFNYCYSQFEIRGFKDLRPQSFNPNFEEYDQKTAMYMAHLSNLAYEDSNEIKSCIEIFDLIDSNIQYKYEFIEHKGTSTEVLLFGHKKFIIIAFRGTKELKDFYTDAKFFSFKSIIDSTDTTKNGMFKHLATGHGGFRKSIMKLMQEEHLLNRINKFITKMDVGVKEIPIYTTGHSLGAALSSLFLGVLIGEGYNFKGAYHFAPPLTLGKCAVKKLQDNKIVKNNVYDIVNNTDVITRIPRYGRRNYMHVGKFYRILKVSNDDLLIYKETEHYFRYKNMEKLRPIKALFSKYHSLSIYIDGVSNSNNSIEAIENRSKELNGCSCMQPNCN
jgi:hypothetical protein